MTATFIIVPNRQACCPQAVHMEKQALKRAREAFLSGRTRPIEFRLQQLHELQRMVTEKENEICTALKQDINRVSGNPVHCCMQYRNIYFKPQQSNKVCGECDVPQGSCLV